MRVPSLGYLPSLTGVSKHPSTRTPGVHSIERGRRLDRAIDPVHRVGGIRVRVCVCVHIGFDICVGIGVRGARYHHA